MTMRTGIVQVLESEYLHDAAFRKILFSKFIPYSISYQQDDNHTFFELYGESPEFDEIGESDFIPYYRFDEEMNFTKEVRENKYTPRPSF